MIYIKISKFTGLFAQMLEKSWYIRYASDFKYLHLFQRYSLSQTEIVRNLAKYCMFLTLKFFGGGSPTILDRNYKIKHTSHHDAKFHGDLLMNLGDLLVRKKEMPAKNISPFQKLSFPGRLTMRLFLKLHNMKYNMQKLLGCINHQSVTKTSHKGLYFPYCKIVFYTATLHNFRQKLFMVPPLIGWDSIAEQKPNYSEAHLKFRVLIL